MCNRIEKKKKDESAYFPNSVLLNALGFVAQNYTVYTLCGCVFQKIHSGFAHIQLVAESSRTW
jgi:hypothetical protein